MELAARRLEDHEVFEPADDPVLLLGALPSTVMAAVRTSCPRRTKVWSCSAPSTIARSQAYSSISMRAPVDGLDVVDEVAGELEPVGLDRLDALLLGIGVGGLLLGVGGQHLRLVADEVGGEKSPRRAVDTFRSRISCRARVAVMRTMRFSALPYWLGPRTIAMA